MDEIRYKLLNACFYIQQVILVNDPDSENTVIQGMDDLSDWT
jgi:hypothetical protein